MTEISLTEFADRMMEIMPVMMREFARRQESELFRSKITLPQFLILNLLHGLNEARMTELAKFMKVTTAAMTGIVDRLVRDGYVSRHYEPKDRRIIKIRLTPKGDKLVNKANQERRQMLLNVFGKISGQDRRDYLRILTRIKDILTSETKGENK
jgi:DNA-binding MarR family transcriptional regulator